MNACSDADASKFGTRDLPIGSGTGQHLVDSDNVERVDPDPQVESLFTSSLDNVLVGTNSSGFESFG